MTISTAGAGAVSRIHPSIAWLAAGLALAVGVWLCSAMLSPYFMRLAVLTAIYVCLAICYNLVITEAGQFHLGFMAYFAVGAYAVAIPTTQFGWDLYAALFLSIGVVGVFSLALGFLLLRFRGDYLSVVSLAAAEILRLTVANWRDLTGGHQGLPGVPAPMLFGKELYEQQYFLIFAVVLAFVTVATVTAMTRRGAGLAWRAIRQNERAAKSFGLQTAWYKQLSFQVAGLFSGLAGAIYASYQTIVDPSLFVIDGTVMLLTIVILGGGTLGGLIAAGLVVINLPEVTRAFDEYRMLLLGVLFVVLMNWRPNGFGRKATPIYRSAQANGAAPAAAVPRSDGAPLLEVERATVRFGGLIALDGATFSVEGGRVLGIIGPNGAGKTTLFNTIAGNLSLTDGRIRFRGEELPRRGVGQRSMMGIARTFQNLEICIDLTCLENVMVPLLARNPRLALPFGRNAAGADVGTAMEALGMVGLLHAADLPAGTLSYGDRRRLEIARALAAQPTLLLLDEPAAGMNQTEAGELGQLIRRIRDRGITVILIEHNVRLVREVSDRVLVLANGRIIADEEPQAVLKNPAVVEAYLGKRVDVVA